MQSDIRKTRNGAYKLEYKMTYRPLIEEYSVEDIPVVAFLPECAKNPPTIIHYHGWSSDVDSQILLGQIFASQGFRVLMPEILDHGRRGERDYSTFNGSTTVIKKSIEEYPLVLKSIKDRFNFEKLYLSGHSLGGMIISVLSNIHDVDGVIIYNSIYDFESYLEEMAMDPEYRKHMSPQTIDDFEELMEFISLERLKTVEYIINTGLQDLVIKPKLMGDLDYTLAMERYNNGVFNFYNDQGHGIGYKMIRDTIEYLRRE